MNATTTAPYATIVVARGSPRMPRGQGQEEKGPPGRQFAPASSIWSRETSAALRRCALPMLQQAGRQRKRRCRRPPQHETAHQPAPTADRAREQRLSTLLGLLVSCRRHLRAHEEADHEHEEDEVEAQGSSRVINDVSAEPLEVLLHLARTVPMRSDQDPRPRRWQTGRRRPAGDKRSALAAQSLGKWRGQQLEAGFRASRDCRSPSRRRAGRR